MMVGCGKNLSLPPTSDEYFAAMDKGKLAFVAVDLLLTGIIFILFAEECYFVVKTYKHPQISVKSIWLVSIYPVFALTSILGVIAPRAIYICDFVATCYLSVCLFQFSSLLMLYFGTVEHLLEKVKDTGFNLHAKPCCCCLCCPVLPATRKSLVIVRLLIFQTAVLQPIIQFTAAILWADDKFSLFRTGFTDSYFYVNLFKMMSTITAIYGIFVLHGSLQPHLLTHNTKPKQMALTLVQLFFNVQGTIMTIPSKFGLPGCRDGLPSRFQMHEWHHLVLVVEMFLLSVLARVYYRQPLGLDAMLEAQSGSVADIYTPDLTDVYNHEIDHNPPDTDTTQLEALTATAQFPHDEKPSVNDEEVIFDDKSEKQGSRDYIYPVSLERDTRDHSSV